MESGTGSVLVALLSGKYIILVRQPSKGLPLYWKLPGGRIEGNEMPEEAERLRGMVLYVPEASAVPLGA